MRVKILKLFLTFIFISFYISGFSQDTFRKALTRASVIDSLKRSGVILGNTPKKPEILLSTDQALKYLQQRLHPQLWNNSNDPLRQALLNIHSNSLVFHGTNFMYWKLSKSRSLLFPALRLIFFLIPHRQ